MITRKSIYWVWDPMSDPMPVWMSYCSRRFVRVNRYRPAWPHVDMRLKA